MSDDVIRARLLTREASLTAKRAVRLQRLTGELDALVEQVRTVTAELCRSHAWDVTGRIIRVRRPWRSAPLRGLERELADRVMSLAVSAGRRPFDTAALRRAVEDFDGSLAWLAGFTAWRGAALLGGGVAGAGLLASARSLLGEIEALSRRWDEVTASKAHVETVMHPLFLSRPQHPEVSIVIPVHDQADYTFTCLRSIALWGAETPFEVIVVDDCSGPATAEMLATVEGVRVLRNETNLGFLRSCRAGAAAAEGRYLLFLNNDTVVTPGWLDTLMATFAQDPLAGMVGSKLLNADGTLQEAGGLVWYAGKTDNYGREDDAQSPEYNYLRQVDYCSGACVVISRELYDSLGGFDEAFAPAYYEDTDLAFAVRAAGRRVLYQPRSEVFHFDGASHMSSGNAFKVAQMDGNQKKFAAKWAAVVEGHAPAGVNIWADRDRWARGRVLVVDHKVPTPDQDSGSKRMFHILEILTRMGYKVVFWPHNRARTPGYTDALQAVGVEVLYPPYVADLPAYLRAHPGGFDVAIFSRNDAALDFTRPFRAANPGAGVIFDTVDIHFVREGRLAEITGDAEHRRGAGRTRDRELEAAGAADLTLVVSDADGEALRHELPALAVARVSNIHDCREPTVPFEERRDDLLFVGGFAHPPNIDAVRFFVAEVMPLLRQRLPGVRLHVIGAEPPPEVTALDAEDVLVHGHVPEIEPWFDSCKVSVAPLTYGAGVKGKINQSMSRGVPVVATPVAVEGMHLEAGRDILVGESPAQLAEQVVRACTDRALWEALSRAGLANVHAHFSIEAAERDIEAALDRVLGSAHPAEPVGESVGSSGAR